MANRLYTGAELLEKFKGKYIDVYEHYNYQKHITEYEVRGVSKTIRENYNFPEDCISQD